MGLVRKINRQLQYYHNQKFNKKKGFTSPQDFSDKDKERKVIQRVGEVENRGYLSS